MGGYLCIASNGIPPSVSKRFDVHVNCKYQINSVIYIWYICNGLGFMWSNLCMVTLIINCPWWEPVKAFCCEWNERDAANCENCSMQSGRACCFWCCLNMPLVWHKTQINTMRLSSQIQRDQLWKVAIVALRASGIGAAQAEHIEWVYMQLCVRVCAIVITTRN